MVAHIQICVCTVITNVDFRFLVVGYGKWVTSCSDKIRLVDSVGSWPKILVGRD
jgi:hypothetical protein